MKARVSKFLIAFIAVLSGAFTFTGAGTSASGSRFTPEVFESCESTGSAETRQIDLMLLIDQSASLKGSRLGYLRTALLALAPVFQENDSSIRVGVATFSRGAQLRRSLDEGSLTAQEYAEFVASVTLEERLEGATNYLSATQIVLDEFRATSDPLRCKVVIWFTDGEVDLPDQQNRVIEAESVLTDFCGAAGSTSSKASAFRNVGIRPYVVLLTNSPFESQKPRVPQSGQSGKEAEPYRRWASIMALRGLTGDWDEGNGPVPKSDTPCDGYSDAWGELILVDGVGELTRQLIEIVIKGTTDVPTNFCPKAETSLLGLPAGIFFEKILVSVNRAEEFGNSDLVTEPSELQRFVSGDLLVLNRKNGAQAAALDALPPGWNLQFEEPVTSVCFGYAFRSRDELQFVGQPNLKTVRIPRRLGDEELSAEIDFRVFTQAIDLNRLEWTDNSVNMNGAIARITPSTISETLEKIPGSLLVFPAGLGKDGESIVADSPILGSLRLSPPVPVLGSEELPRIECTESDSENRPLLAISAVREEVATSPYRSAGTCVIVKGTGTLPGRIVLTLSNPAITEPDNGGFGLVFEGDDAGPARRLEIDASQLDTGSEIRFLVAQAEPFPNQQVDVSQAAEIEAIYKDGDDSLEIERIRVVTNLSLLGRSDTTLALVIAVFASVLSALLAYVVLFVMIRKTARVGRPSDLVYLTCDIEVMKQGNLAGTGIHWLDREKFVPPAFDVTKVREVGESGRKIAADRIELDARTGNFFRPLDVVRGPWAVVRSTETNSLGLGLSSDGRKPGSALCPLGPVVIADVLSKNLQTDRYGVRLTFIVPTRGPNASLPGIQNLIRTSAMTAISKAVNNANSAPEIARNGSLVSNAEESATGRRGLPESARPSPRGDVPRQTPVVEPSGREQQTRPTRPATPPQDGSDRRPPGASPR